MTKTFCHAEGQPFEATEFAKTSDGIEIHVITNTRGHTTDGWDATYEGTRHDGVWRIKNIVVKTAPIETADAEVSRDDAG